MISRKLEAGDYFWAVKITQNYSLSGENFKNLQIHGGMRDAMNKNKKYPRPLTDQELLNRHFYIPLKCYESRDSTSSKCRRSEWA